MLERETPTTCLLAFITCPQISEDHKRLTTRSRPLLRRAFSCLEPLQYDTPTLRQPRLSTCWIGILHAKLFTYCIYEPSRENVYREGRKEGRNKSTDKEGSKEGRKSHRSRRLRRPSHRRAPHQQPALSSVRLRGHKVCQHGCEPVLYRFEESIMAPLSSVTSEQPKPATPRPIAPTSMLDNMAVQDKTCMLS